MLAKARSGDKADQTDQTDQIDLTDQKMIAYEILFIVIKYRMALEDHHHKISDIVTPLTKNSFSFLFFLLRGT